MRPVQLAHQHPSVPASSILAGGYAGWAGSPPPEEVQQRLRRALDLGETLPDGFDPTTVPGLFSDAMPPGRRAALLRVMSEIRPTGTRVMAHAFAEADLRDSLGAIGVPTLLLHGADDARSPLDVAHELQGSIPGSQLVVLPGLGHEAFAEFPETFDTHVRAFLDQVEDPPSGISCTWWACDAPGAPGGCPGRDVVARHLSRRGNPGRHP